MRPRHTHHTRKAKPGSPFAGVLGLISDFRLRLLHRSITDTAQSAARREIESESQVRGSWMSPFKLTSSGGFVMPTVIILIVIMSFVAYAALLQSNNSLNLAYKQAYIQMARTGAKAAIDYAQEQFDNATCGDYSGTAEQNLVSNSRYRVTFQSEVVNTSADGFEKTIKGTGRVYLPLLSTTAQYVFDIRSEIIRTYATCKTPDNFAPVLWLDAGDLTTLYEPGATSTVSVTSATSFGSAGSTTRDTIEERVDNGGQTANSWQSTDLEMHVCDNGEFSSSICSNNSSRYLYDGIVFSNVNVPQGATITSAVINYDCAAGGASGSVTHRIRGIYKTSTNLHPDLFTSTGSNQVKTPLTTSGRNTAASADLSTNNCPPGQGNSMTVTNVVQEIVDHASWDPSTGGGRMGFGLQRISGNGQRRFAKNNIRLVVTYATSSGPQLSNANNDTIAEWHDKSGNGNHAIAAYNAPIRIDNQINGRTILRFSDDAMLSALTSALSGKREMTVFAVMKSNFSTSDNDGRVVSGMTSSQTSDTSGATAIIPLFRYNTNNGFSNQYTGNSNSYRTNFTCGSACNSTSYLFTSVFNINDSDSIDSTLKGNGASVATRSNINPSGSPYTYSINQLYIGGRRSGAMPGSGADFLNGEYAEIVVYDKALECRQIEALEDYFRGKWNLNATAFTPACPDDTIPTL